MTLQTSEQSPAPVRVISNLLHDYINRLSSIWIEGQVAQYRVRPGANVQFLTLRDTDAEFSLKIMVNSALIGAMDPPLAEGQRIVIFGRCDFWPKQGSLQVVAREIRAVGLGELLAQLAALKEKLTAEGLFAPGRKKPLPFLPDRIGLITGRQSDAMHDVLTHTKERWPRADFEIREVAIQGVNAVGEVTAALQELDTLELDVIVIARGGGSMEDLLPFSNEALIRAVSIAGTPVVSAIGHEQDTPLLDFVADLRASTPTDAAKRIVPSVVEERRNLAELRARNLRAIANLLNINKLKLHELRNRLTQRVTHRIDAELATVTHLRAQIRALSPAATLERGYAIVQGVKGEIIRNQAQVGVDQEVQIRVSVGEFSATRNDNKK
ncbi:MAG: exodeoxyribonuclease VII large subunit [Candidatus Nanopelagicales bacterium]|nr:exodeoxyribonuclease VII large subunit [Actinomycetota bacterium]NCG01918.1 exodeoxyribonuclease VII large subunit [Actinomycetales bacterium]MBT5500804.1 exodeoxyribonuclease VII large subunit [Actinomycetota bacterium]MBT5806986.1 exodeoxyribonuclease VII large subunit [Actinomycetota bacterium]MDA9016976.1 exodeoxyribonuclease VII large subunit [Actinomycetota bacterium]